MRRAEAGGHFLIMNARILAGDGGDFSGQQTEDDAVLVSRPYRTIATQEAGPGAFLATKADAAVKQTAREPFETNRHFQQLAAQAGYNAVDQTT